MPIYFYSTIDHYGCFSNFSTHGLELEGYFWPTAEHYFQAQKFAGTPYAEQIRRAKTPEQAARLGRSRDVKLRSDWEEVKDTIMQRAVLKKFETHSNLREILLNTGDEEIIENAPGDYYWGCGANGTGQNKLGKILMEVRAILRQR